MMQGTLHPAPRGRDVVREQIRIVGLGLRREALIVAIVLGIVTVKIAIDAVRGSADSWFDSDEWFPIGFAAFLFPFAVWRRDRRFEPGFFWTLPVDRRRLAFARVFGGWVWLMAAFVGLVLWQFVLASLSGVEHPEILPLVAGTGVTAMYLFGSALVLGLRHPLRWLLGTAGVFLLLGMLGQAREVDAFLGSSGVMAVVQQADAVWRSMPPLLQFVTSTFLWLGSALAALWPAIGRHGERRRP